MQILRKPIELDWFRFAYERDLPSLRGFIEIVRVQTLLSPLPCIRQTERPKHLKSYVISVALDQLYISVKSPHVFKCQRHRCIKYKLFIAAISFAREFDLNTIY